MPELRQDPVTGAWVVVATERAKRPDTFPVVATREVATDTCPFCEGHERMTPPEIEADRPHSGPDSPGWQLRVVPNKFPAFVAEAEQPAAHGALYKAVRAEGRHEVIIHSPDHGLALGNMNTAQVVRVLGAYQRRLIANGEDGPSRSVLIIVNHGKEAGASIDHPHSQVFAVPLVLPLLAQEIEGAEAHLKREGMCVFCRMIELEKHKGALVIAENDKAIALAPYASMYPFEVWLLPKTHMPAFETALEDTLTATADLLRQVLASITRQLHNPAYNMWLHTRPVGGDSDAYHWHFEIVPKTSSIAGFEMGSGVMINIVNPEDAASLLGGGIE